MTMVPSVEGVNATAPDLPVVADCNPACATCNDGSEVNARDEVDGLAGLGNAWPRMKSRTSWKTSTAMAPPRIPAEVP